MRAEDHAHAGGRALVEDLGHGGDPDGVEAGEGLVEDQELRVVDQRRGELHALLVAVGEVLQLGLGAIREPEPLQPGTAAGACVAPAEPVVLAEVRELLCHSHPGIQAALLGHVAEAQARLRIDGGAVPAHVAAIRGGQAEHAAHRGRLAGPVRAQEADQPTTAGRERGVVERRDGPVALREPPDLEHVTPGWHRPEPGLDRSNSTPAGPAGRTIGPSQGGARMTTPDPIPGPDAAPDDATSAYDAEAAPLPPAGPMPSAPPSAPASAPQGAPATAAAAPRRRSRSRRRCSPGLERHGRPPARSRAGSRRPRRASSPAWSS